MIKNCNKCPLSKTRVNIVTGRGRIDAKILIIGESPGKSDDVLGQAFIGESGALLDILLKDSGIDPGMCFFTNTILCRACDSRTGENREPKPEEIFLCLENVLKIINSLKRVQGIVIAGKVSKQWYGNRFKGTPQCVIIHPAALLRQGGKASSHWLDMKNILSDFRKDMLDAKSTIS
jgi:uracil-DNA glycosylase family 4